MGSRSSPAGSSRTVDGLREGPAGGGELGPAAGPGRIQLCVPHPSSPHVTGWEEINKPDNRFATGVPTGG
ncbi:hypothetical protein GCM10010394_20380 [Streptomyces crystallinus]|uniref:Uncharacterized protein n=1 Tax=Streptomyces crystallinus TaxID=68191 RepID=A0ABN1FHK0_9ACTN